MKLCILSSFLSLFTFALAGGYQGCLERIVMYQAYLIDGMNPAGSQTMGMQCVGANWDDRNKRCIGAWTPMRGHAPGQRVNYDQWVYNLAKAPGAGITWSVLNPDGTMNIEQTAQRTYDLYTRGTPGQVNQPTVRNFGAHKFMQNTVEWNDAIIKSSKLVEQAYKNKAGILTAEERQYFRDYDRATELVLAARVGDHGKALINQARPKLAAEGITLVTKNVGPNPRDRPAPNDNPWDTVDWKETIRQAEAAGVAGARAKVQAVAKDIYQQKRPSPENPKGHNAAREHKQVIDSFRRAANAKLGCGRP